MPVVHSGEHWQYVCKMVRQAHSYHGAYSSPVGLFRSKGRQPHLCELFRLWTTCMHLYIIHWKVLRMYLRSGIESASPMTTICSTSSPFKTWILSFIALHSGQHDSVLTSTILTYRPYNRTWMPPAMWRLRASTRSLSLWAPEMDRLALQQDATRMLMPYVPKSTPSSPNVGHGQAMQLGTAF